MRPLTLTLLLFLATFPVFSAGIEIPSYIDTTAIVYHTGFTLEYAEPYEQARWVAYTLTKERVNGTIARTDNFRIDPLVKTGSATLEDYKGSGFDRGHLCPAADNKWSVEAMNDCFYMSNMTPQTPAFNQGIWENLESQVRQWAVLFDTIYIATGGVLRQGLFKIGTDSVSVPEYFYKVVLCFTGKDTMAIGFVMKNEGSKEPLSSFAVMVDSVESITGIDFFPSLPDDIEQRIERNVNMSKWFSNSAIKRQHEPARYQKHRNKYLRGGEIKLNLNGRIMEKTIKMGLVISFDKNSLSAGKTIKL